MKKPKKSNKFTFKKRLVMEVCITILSINIVGSIFTINVNMPTINIIENIKVHEIHNEVINYNIYYN